jgi:hypothetical protein
MQEEFIDSDELRINHDGWGLSMAPKPFALRSRARRLCKAYTPDVLSAHWHTVQPAMRTTGA